MKKFVNDPRNFVGEMLTGIELATELRIVGGPSNPRPEVES